MLNSLWQNIKSKVPIINYLYFTKISDFCCKIEIFVPFHIYFASNITLVLRFMISKKFYYDQTAKVNSKDVSC